LSDNILKKCFVSLAPTVTELFRLSIDSSEIPKVWKTSIITTIFKSGNKNDPRNYRPISLVCSLGSLDDFYSNLSKNNNIDIIYIDLKEAFDSVPITNSFPFSLKLHKYGIRGKILNWIKNFLAGRSFKVKINQFVSASKFSYSGVPQGSCLGPLLFLIYINDLPNFNAVKNWTRMWKIGINPNKTFLLRLRKKNMNYKYTIDLDEIKETSEMRDLGVLLNNSLDFDSHIAKIIRITYCYVRLLTTNYLAK
jgi:hypothetical protein